MKKLQNGKETVCYVMNLLLKDNIATPWWSQEEHGLRDYIYISGIVNQLRLKIVRIG